ncbi:hypothetical protein AJ88_31900 [Mesorhizobium amorphae CCBAU 01583]|nr:hypothetical protein AJ88_31900 [Mesorhizobium amorphae CCBAU 01583]
MANAFDQFDPPSSKPSATGGNVFDQFDAAPAPVSPAPPADQPSAVKDLVYSAAAGVPRGAVELGMLPVTAARIVKEGGQALYDKVEDPIRSVFGYGPVTPEDKAQREADDKNSYLGGFLQRMFEGQDAVRGKMDENLYAPRTTPGEYGRTIGEFLVPGGVASKVGPAATTGREIVQKGAETLGNVVTPAIVSETAGQATEGTQYEGLARFLGALFGNVGSAAYKSFRPGERRAPRHGRDERC